MDELGIVFIICIAVICVALPMAIRTTMKDKKQGNDLFSSLNSRINDTYFKVFGTGGGTPVQQLNALWDFAEKSVGGVLENYVKDHNITKIADTFSDLGCCGISDTHFFALLDQTDSSEYDGLMNAGNLTSKYNEVLSYIERSKGSIATYPQKDEIIAYISRILPLYAKLKQTGCKSQAITVAFNDILYYKIEGNVHHLSNVTGGGVNMQGAVAGAIIGGGAAAIIGSQLGTETTTQIVTQDDRKITLYINENNRHETLTIGSRNVEKTIEALRELIPNKEESVVQIESSKNANTTAAVSSADELKKFKELLDCGIISQEEFDAKKKQLLGL